MLSCLSYWRYTIFPYNSSFELCSDCLSQSHYNTVSGVLVPHEMSSRQDQILQANLDI